MKLNYKKILKELCIRIIKNENLSNENDAIILLKEKLKEGKKITLAFMVGLLNLDRSKLTK